MATFGPGDFGDGVSLLGPGDLATLGERIPAHYDDRELAALVVFAMTSGGAFYCWNEEGRVYFVPPEATRFSATEEVCDDIKGWVDELQDSKFSPPGLERLFFIPAGALPQALQWQAEASANYAAAHESLHRAVAARGGTILSFLEGPKTTRTQFGSDGNDAFAATQTVSPEVRGRSRFNTRIRIQYAGTAPPQWMRETFLEAGWQLE
jgi:hypothetical protein